jgi:hypothetical protein
VCCTVSCYGGPATGKGGLDAFCDIFQAARSLAIIAAVRGRLGELAAKLLLWLRKNALMNYSFGDPIDIDEIASQIMRDVSDSSASRRYSFIVLFSIGGGIRRGA